MFLSVVNDVVALVRNRTLFLVSTNSSAAQAVEFELLQEQDVQLDAAKASNDDDGDDEQPQQQQHGVAPSNRITGVQFFQPSAQVYALLVLVDDRKLVHYEVDVPAGKVEFRSVR